MVDHQNKRGDLNQLELKTDPSTDPPGHLRYICSDCGNHNLLSSTSPLRCVKCAHRVLFKFRTRRMVQFEAR
ncbi:hypothetical protein CONCODRAFT_37323 [Conidiobolus coronatus NRRL 28638]|jgi:DNA-directed RNA polymerase subunit RPC12/RpoP|uniref:Uncharacterized protein n=1 Tax=Conidiobolus coronatus (strain ATCC 28846 / CBS 209.66 / NRRL 28638) TaxID=796925 RepID=A0A137PB36_CONC2|nr:hypothetical protein CONCODRAFT_37323 [Conidiobolus coronatus NRRL 28638]|eukprot:KXN72142.1 hypothetical protein CONCODRAFT_37323 [Conidiobolus coronatus NRRL 28638]